MGKDDNIIKNEVIAESERRNYERVRIRIIHILLLI
ncbi:hypothetical protein Halha_1488 [Halobacteroides halobius DSM 5150]|uniref:Uncharacterized protein n=1 Tax=Halobacteroides halobius (strain ATCC 35273 / DSM 5150 / MD-1) TaxID=748449 RepID=L0KA71_HALHC|nr:hypothetical protein Halha_1488 [Halobacteroides halobius DSM 5150]